ncbi:hypothetical protein MLD38_000903 [Melastoma candidum]|uniref:Uncharacterized protein n=1 Tax=Melastoma candidum TaxID=119954 RepID=A0ACB9SBL6_9MYRT|nr:hypothetical protein MLD38_000903 [Melastoma candidum]
MSSSAYMNHPRPAMEMVGLENGARLETLLHAMDDEFGGVTVEMKNDGAKPEVFAVLLRNSLSMWKRQARTRSPSRPPSFVIFYDLYRLCSLFPRMLLSRRRMGCLQGKQGVWIKFPIGLENLHDIAAREGFEYHHAERDYVMMTNWMPMTPSTLPGNATHRVTIGAIILNDRREVLVVQEKKGKFRGIWKIPTGTANTGEDIEDAAQREVKEETGIDTEFLGILSFRVLHSAFFRWSDMTFFCAMRPTSFDIQTQEAEIDAAEWMPMEAFVSQPFAREDEVCRHVIDLCFTKLDQGYTGWTPNEVKSTLDDKPSVLYFNSRDLHKPVLASADHQPSY